MFSFELLAYRKLINEKAMPGSDDPAAVAISHGDDFTKWDVVAIPKPEDLEMWGESTVIADGRVYVGSGARGKGIGLALLDALVASSEAQGIWTLQAGLFPENVASVRIHERLGFRVVGVRERLGQLAGVWRDVLLMERRSQVSGV